MNTTNIRVISCDLDGTLLNAQGKITKHSESVLLDLQKKGYIVVLNSGRFYHELESFIKQLKLDVYGGYAICSNGYIIYDCKNKTTHTFDSISYSESTTLFQLAKQAHTLTFYYANNSYYICAPWSIVILKQLSKFFIRLIQPILPTRFRKYIPMYLQTEFHTYKHIPVFTHVEKLCFNQLPFLLRRLRRNIDKNTQGYQFFDVNSFSMELVKDTVSKADAIRFLCAQKGYTINQVIAFGDAGNDIPLLQQAGIGVVMKNARKHMHLHSSISTTLSNHQDGVAIFLEEHLKNSMQ